MSKTPPEPEDHLPFLEINDEAPEYPRTPAADTNSQDSNSSASHSPFEREHLTSLPPRSLPQRPRADLMSHPQFKWVVGTGATFLVLMVLFRVPPAVILIAVFSVLRIAFIPLALLGFLWWAFRQSRRR